MTQFPDLALLFKNSGLWHQFLSHFPFVLWTVATLLYVLALNARLQWLYGSALVVGCLGSAFGGLSWLTGERLVRDQAAPFTRAIVSEHQANAYLALIVFTGVFVTAAVLRGLRNRYPNWNIENSWIRGVSVLALAFACFYLFVSTQDGVRLVQQHQSHTREILNAR